MYLSSLSYRKCVTLLAALLFTGSAWSDVTELNTQVRQLYEQKQYQQAVTLAQQALAEAESTEASPSTINICINNLAAMYSSAERYNEALPLYQRALAFSEAKSGAEHPDTAKSASRLARIYQQVGRYDDALLLFQRALEIDEKVLGPDHPDTVRDLSYLAGGYRSKGEYGEALWRFRKVLSIREQATEQNDSTLSISMYNVAVVLRAMGRSSEALPLLERVLALDERVSGSNDPETAVTLNSLASLYKDMGRYGEALPLYKRALAIHEKTPGEDYHDTAIDLNNLGLLYQLMGRSDEALRLYERALVIVEKIFGPDHLELAGILNNLGGVYEGQRDFDEALALYQRALVIREKNLSPYHVSLSVSFNSLAGLYVTMKRYGEALPLYERALAIDEKSLGLEHPGTATTINNLAMLYQSMGRGDEAQPLLRRAVRIVADTDIRDQSRDHGAINSLAVFSANLAGSLQRQETPGALDEAIFYYKLSVNARQRMRAGTRGMDVDMRESFTRKVAGPYRSLSVLLVQRKRMAEAERVLLLLKESELTAYLRRNGADGGGQQGLIWTDEEETYRKSLELIAARWREYAQRHREVMDGVKQGALSDPGPETQVLVERRIQLDAQTRNIMDDAKRQLVAAAVEANRVQDAAFKVARTKLSSKLALLSMRNGGMRTAGLVLQPTERGLLTIVTTGLGAVPLISNVSEERINILVNALRHAIQARKDYRKPARELYSLLIEPAEKQLAGSGTVDVQQWAILPFGNLRALPYAALIAPDGRHLIERYAVTMLTADGGGGLDGLEASGSDIWHGVAFGASQANADFGNIPLPGVRDEVCGVIRDEAGQSCLAVQGIISGRRYIDAAFTSGMLQYWLAGGSSGAEVLHIATHYKVEQSQLLLGDGSKLTTGELLGWNPKLEQYDMIVLSACDSGISEGAVESLAGVFRSLGAKTVMATLWPVADVGATPMMLEFYRQRGETRVMSKAAALRKTQIAMIDGKIYGGAAANDLRHPYFWASYVLMGNWL